MWAAFPQSGPSITSCPPLLFRRLPNLKLKSVHSTIYYTSCKELEERTPRSLAHVLTVYGEGKVSGPHLRLDGHTSHVHTKKHTLTHKYAQLLGQEKSGGGGGALWRDGSVHKVATEVTLDLPFCSNIIYLSSFPSSPPFF